MSATHPRNLLTYYVTGAIGRGEAEAIVEIPAKEPVMNRKVTIGSISHGTLRPEGLIPAFIDKATELLHEVDCPLSSAEIGTWNARLGDMERRMVNMPDYYESDAAIWDYEDLYDLLCELAPEGTFFGAHPGDGSDFGFWPAFARIEEARESEELESGAELPVDSTESGLFLQVSDHGNMELYQWNGGGWISLWSCV